MRRQTLIGALFLLSAIATQAAQAASEVTPSERVRRNVIVRAEPNTASPTLDSLVPGEGLPLEGQVPGWYQVRLPDGRIGYVTKGWTVVLDADDTLPAGPVRMHVIDVGTGLAVFIDGPTFTMLYDGGSQDDQGKGSKNRIRLWACGASLYGFRIS